MKRKTALFLAILIGAATLVSAQTRPTHIVKAGETLFAISRQYSVTVEQIREWNQLSGNTISTGQRLFVGPPAGQAPASSSVQHRVQPGETLFSISRRYGVTVSEIMDWNRMTSMTIDTGQILDIRRSVQNVREGSVSMADTSRAIVTEAAPSAYYVVRRGDALSRVAEQYGLSLAEIRELNKLRSDVLTPGQVLLIRKPEAVPGVAADDTRSGPQGRFARYTWKRGDQLADVLNRFRMSESELAALNPHFDIRSIQPGGELVVLLPPSTTYRNPYMATRQDPTTLGTFNAGLYPDSDRGRRLTSGDLYAPDRLTAGHNSIPLGTIVYVENARSGTGLYVQVNDRILEPEFRLSRSAWAALGLQAGQINTVRVYSQD